MAELINLGEKGQIVIPKKLREYFNLKKGNKIIISEENGRIIMKPAKIDEKHILMLLSENSLKKVWDNKYDERWDEVF
ncbi:MAG: AbrB/MazE/SpoVT family DNA-binding domain-containing protein [Nanoarchaeota archaeon]